MRVRLFPSGLFFATSALPAARQASQAENAPGTERMRTIFAWHPCENQSADPQSADPPGAFYAIPGVKSGGLFRFQSKYALLLL
jgi:hypothetical protein